MELTKEQKLKDQKKLLLKIAAFVACVGLAFYLVANHNFASDGYGEGPSRGEAWHLCKQEVAAQLRNPDSADFAVLSADYAEQADGGWSITGSVKADNDYGVTQELGYSCSITVDGAVSASVS